MAGWCSMGTFNDPCSGKIRQDSKTQPKTSTHIVLCQVLWTCGRKIMETLFMWVLARGQRKAFYILGGVESLAVYAYNYYLVTSCEVPLAFASDRDELPHIPRLLIWVGKITLQHTSWFTGRHMTSYWSIWIIITRSVRTRCIFISLTPWISLDTVVAWPCQRIQPWSALNQGELNALNKTHAG